MARHDAPTRQARVGDVVLVRLPGAHDDHLYPAIVIRAVLDLLSVAVFVDSHAKSAAAQGPVVTCEGVEPLDRSPAKALAGGWCWRDRDGMG